MDSNNRYNFIPKGERECIWMKAGIILYKLCDRDYQCENCPFDQAMRNEFDPEDSFPESEIGPEEESLISDYSSSINGSAFYHPNHCWVKVENPEKTKIGVDDFLIQLVEDFKVIVLPHPGDFITQGKYFFHIIQEDRVVPIISPLTGRILAIKTRLQKKPRLVLNNPQEDGWLVKIKPENLERDLKNLFFGKNASNWRRREEIKLMNISNSALNNAQKDLGPTMQDGGVKINQSENFFTSEQYSHILEFFITKPKNIVATRVHGSRDCG